VQSKKLAALAETTLDDMKARDVRVIDVRKLTTVTDYMIIASGTSDRHVRSIADRLVERATEAGCKPLGTEGGDAGEWVLVDLQDVVVHVMQGKIRDVYKLENLWDMQAPAAGSAG
jgi:ribosome-associated protein